MTPEQNKQIVLEAFEMLFNRKDFEGAKRFWAPNYIQHNPLVPDGREALFAFVRSLPASTRFEYQLAVAEGDYVLIHARYSKNGFPANWVVVDILKLENGIMVEHWDVIQDEAKQSASGHPMFGSQFAGSELTSPTEDN
jgi:predicted SnoaL-like aldol condensation-catalyzing enzyme